MQDYDELLEVSQLLAHCPRPSRPGIAVVSHSGGISSLTADMCGQAGLELPLLSDGATNGINEILQGFGWAANPADVTGFAMGNAFPDIMEYMLNEPAVGTLAVASSGGDSQAEQVIGLRDHALRPAEGESKGVVFLWTGSRAAASGLGKLKEAQVPIFYTPNRLAGGLRSLSNYYAWRDRCLREGFPGAPAMNRQQQQTLRRLLPTPGRQTLSEHDSKEFINAWGIPSTRELLVTSADEAVDAARELGYPVAIKVDSPDLPHKTEAGVVRLGVGDDAGMHNAFADVMSNARRWFQSLQAEQIPHSPPSQKGRLGEFTINGVLVQEIVVGAVEVIVGVSYDKQLGPVLLFGTGGMMVEVYDDVALRLCPIVPEDAGDMVAEVKGARLLRGFRGRPAADIDALCETLVQVSHLAVNLEGTLAELDINPLMVLAAGQGVKAADALVIFQS